MKNKLIAFIAALMVFGAANTFALGIGLQTGGSVAGFDAGVTFKLDKYPLVFVANGSFGDHITLGLIGDMWLGNPNLVAMLNAYYGWGLGGSVALSDDYVGLGGAGRIVGGLNAKFIDDFLEFFLQVAWQPGVAIGLGNDSGGLGIEVVNFPVNFGFRLWF